ncbi:CBS domain-containing protein [Anaerobacillus sp. MEB173]|uniref:CBS domain-containing protein n=1 Tax=Anaerobacillus sp. MEB173 TaxID=3383345 RepID=UPI003F91F7E8
MASNADRFITAFNSIEKALKKELLLDRHYSFIKLVDLSKKRNPLVMKYELDLKKFAELRNAIVHEQTEIEFIIAEPHIQIVEEIEKIKEELTKPELVIPRFKRKVIYFQLEDRLTTVLKAIKEHAFTQYPIYKDGKFFGLITENGIVRWLSNKVDKDQITLNSKTLDQVMLYERHAQNVIFIHKETTLYEAQDLFVKQLDKKFTRLDALLITETGDKNEPLLGIITPYDVIKFKF